MDRIGVIYRAFALLIDLIIITVLFVFLLIGLVIASRSGYFDLEQLRTLKDNIDWNNPPFILIVVASSVYGSILIYYSTEIFFAGSPGKLLMGLFIGNVNGEEARGTELLARYCFKFSPHICTIAGILLLSINPSSAAVLFLSSKIANIVVGFGSLGILGSKKQTVYDIFSGTAVFRSSDIYINMDLSQTDIDPRRLSDQPRPDPNSRLLF